MASRSWNRVELIGNLTRDPELRYTPNGAAVVTFSIATNRTYVSDGERKEEVDFHRLVAWNKLAELCNQLLKKGNRVFVSGRLQNRSWEDATSGQTKQITEIVLEDMILLTPKTTSESSFSGETVPAPEQNIAPASAPTKEKAEKPEKPTSAEESSDEKVAPKESISDDDLPF